MKYVFKLICVYFTLFSKFYKMVFMAPLFAFCILKFFLNVLRISDALQLHIQNSRIIKSVALQMSLR